MQLIYSGKFTKDSILRPHLGVYAGKVDNCVLSIFDTVNTVGDNTVTYKFKLPVTVNYNGVCLVRVEDDNSFEIFVQEVI